MIIDKRITEYQKYAIKQFIKNGGDPQDYVPHDTLNLDNIVKKRTTFTVTEQQKDIINAFLCCTTSTPYSLTTTTTTNADTDTFTISKTSNLYISLANIADFDMRSLDNAEEWCRLDDVAFVETLLKAAKNYRKHLKNEGKLEEQQTKKAEKAEHVQKELATYYSTPPEPKALRRDLKLSAAAKRLIDNTKDPYHSDFIKVNARPFTEWTDEQINMHRSSLILKHSTLPADISQYDLPFFTKPNARFDSANIDYQLATDYLELGLCTFEQIEQALKNDGELDYFIQKFYKGYDFAEKSFRYRFKHHPSYTGHAFDSTFNAWGDQSGCCCHYMSNVNNLTVMKCATKIGEYFKKASEILLNGDHQSNRCLYDNNIDFENFYEEFCKDKLDGAFLNVDINFSFFSMMRSVQNKSSTDDVTFVFDGSKNIASITSVEGETKNYPIEEYNQREKLVLCINFWKLVNTHDNDNGETIKEKIKNDNNIYIIDDGISGTIYEIIDMFYSTYPFGNARPDTVYYNEPNFFVNYSEAFDEGAVMGFGCDGYFHFKEGYGKYCTHLQDIIKPYSEYLEFYYVYDNKTKHFTKKIYYNTFEGRYQDSIVEYNRYKEMKDENGKNYYAKFDNDGNIIGKFRP